MASKIIPKRDGSGITNDQNGNRVYISKSVMRRMEKEAREFAEVVGNRFCNCAECKKKDRK